MNKLPVLIIGAGRIGAFLDSPQSPLYRTHAHAFSAHPGFSLAGFVDADPARAAKAAAVWGGEAFASIAEAMEARTIDVAVMAASDAEHYPLLKTLAGFPLRLVLAEKPLTRSLAQAEEIVALYRERGIGLCVNFSRRFVPEVISLRTRIASGEFGRFLSGTGTYGKGTLHNGSHLVDLVHYLLGEIAGVHMVSSIRDWSEDDPTCSAMVKMKSGGELFMQGIDSRLCTIFETDLFFERQRVRIVDFGLRMELYDIKEDAADPGFRFLEPPVCINTQHANALVFAAAHVHAHLENGTPLCSTGTDGLAAQIICTTILDGTRMDTDRNLC